MRVKAPERLASPPGECDKVCRWYCSNWISALGVDAERDPRQRGDERFRLEAAREPGGVRPRSSSRLAGCCHRWQSGTAGRSGGPGGRNEGRGSHESPEDVLARDRPAERRRGAGTRGGRARGHRSARRPAPPGPLPGGYTNLVVIYEENHSLRQPVRQLGSVGGQRVDGLQSAGGTTTQVAQDGTPYGCLLQNDVNLTSPRRWPTTCTDPAHGVPASHFAQQPVHDRRLHPADRHDLPGRPGVFAPNGVLNGTGRRPVAARVTSSTASTRSSTRSTAASRTATSPARDAVGLTMGHYDDAGAADLPVPAQQGRAATTWSPTGSSRRPSAARSSTTST